MRHLCHLWTAFDAGDPVPPDSLTYVDTHLGTVAHFAAYVQQARRCPLPVRL
jgi:hypothetical protein